MDSGWIDMSTWFRKMGLPIPPVPVALQPEVVLRSKCHWATSRTPVVDPMDMYFLRPRFVRQTLAQTTTDHVTVCHSGHGSNSYTINYRLAYRELVLFAQAAWGGVYMNNADQSAVIADIFQDCQEVIAVAEARVADTYTSPEGSRLLLMWSTRWQEAARCGWASFDSCPEDSYPVPLVDSGRAVTVVEQLLREGPASQQPGSMSEGPSDERSI